MWQMNACAMYYVRVRRRGPSVDLSSLEKNLIFSQTIKSRHFQLAADNQERKESLASDVP
jgi:hypothetical protein